MSDSFEICLHCRFWNRERKLQFGVSSPRFNAECRRRAPKLNQHDRACFPETWDTESCGEWEGLR